MKITASGFWQSKLECGVKLGLRETYDAVRHLHAVGEEEDEGLPSA